MNHSLWYDLFALGLPLTEKVLRPVLVYAFLVVGLRFAGKRELAQLNPFDFVVLMTLSNTVQNGIIGDDNSVTGAMIGAASLLAVNAIVVRVLFSHPNLERIVEGDPDVLIDKGRIIEPNLAKELISRSELAIAAHKQGFGSLDEVERAVLEPGGVISFFRKEPDTATQQFRELEKRLDEIAAAIAALGAARERPA